MLKRRLLLLVLLSITILAKSQTLYWVGGSGYWNDVNHWSTTPGGTPAGQLPNATTDVIFDNQSSDNDFTVHILQGIEINSITSQNQVVKAQLISSPNVQLKVNGSLELTPRFYLNTNGPLLLTPTSACLYRISPYALNSDVKIISNYDVKVEYLNTSKSITLSGSFKLSNSVLISKHLSFSNAAVRLENSFFQTSENIQITNSSLTADLLKPSRFICRQANFSQAVRSALSGIAGITMAPLADCVVVSGTPTNVSCNATCDGIVVFDMSGCATPAGPYDIQWLNTNPAASCQNLPPAESGFSGTTYSVNTVCDCVTPYIVIFTNNTTGEQSFPQALVGKQPKPLLNITLVNPTCFGYCDGQIRTQILSGTPPITIKYITPAPTTTVTHSGIAVGGRDTLKNACIGTYTIVATGDDGCANTFTRTLTQPAQLLANGTSSNVTCNGTCNGSALSAPSGGNAGGYTFSWLSPSSTPSTSTVSSINSLCPGVVTLTVTDTKSCTATYSANITQPPAITLTVTKTNLICGSICDGTATITATGGSGAGYTYTWNPAVSNSASATGLCARDYTVTVADNLNCAKTITFTITSPPTLTATPTQTNLVCNSACIGAINLNPSGGTGAYTYSWSPSVSTGSVASGLCAGAYVYTLTDVVNCTYINMVTITQPPAITVTVSKTDVSCNSVCDGTAIANVSGGTGAYTYSWTSGNPIPSGQGTATITGLCSGTYTVRVTDANSCVRTATVTITQPPPIIANHTSVSPTCNGLCNGSINSAPSGGATPYTFTLVPSSGPSIVGSPPFLNLCAGSYTLLIRDNNGCVKTQTINLVQPNPITLSLSATPVSCFNMCNSTISTVINGGTPSYTISWGSGGTGSSINNACAGVQTATVTDSKGCQATASVNVSSVPDLTVTVTAAQPNCNAQCTGIATATVSGGTPNYTITWNNGTIGNVNSGLCLGVSTVAVVDFLGCTKTQTIAIITPPALTLTPTNGTVSCAGVIPCDGTVSVIATGGTSGYFYSWSSTPTQTTSTATGLCPGSYIASVTDSKGCIASATASVIQPAVLTSSISNVQPSCNVCIGAATANGIGGTGPYTYSWSPGGQSVQTPTNLCIGIHTVTVTDSKGCTTTQTVQINQTINILVTANSNTLACSGSCSGIATANASGGTGPGTYTYTWNPVPVQNTQTATGLCAGNHTVIVSDANGCTNTSVVNFVSPPAITLTVNKTNVSCNALCDGMANANATGGTGAITYSWAPGNYTTAAISNLCAGDYTVTATDVNGCSQTQVVSITQNPALTASFSFTSPTTCTSTDGALSASVSGGAPTYTVLWQPGSSSANPYTGLAAGTYSLFVSDAAGCTQTILTTLSNPTGPTVTVTSSSIACFGSCTGAATLSISGTPPFGVNWPAPVSSTNTVVTNLCAGLYIPQITDGNGCITNQTVNIAQPLQISSTGVVANVPCNSLCTASINLTPSGGIGPYTYTWSPAGGNVEDPVNLCANNYSVDIADANGCIITNTFVINEPPALTLSFNKKDVLCNAGCTGGVRAVVGGGLSPYSYTWTPAAPFVGSNLDTLANLCSGVYTVTASDANGCTISGTISIGEPTALTSTITSVNVKCNNVCNGSAVMSSSGGTLPYVFFMNGIPTQSLTGLCVGTYTGTVTDANGCISSSGFMITQPLPIVITTTVSNPKCNAAFNGSVATSVTGGNPAYHYNWITTGGPVPNPTGLGAGIYTVVVTDDSLCTGTAIVTLVDPPLLIANTSFTNPLCSNTCDGSATANPIGGTIPISYVWSTAAPTNTNQTVSGLCAGDYTVIVTDGNGCQDDQVVTLVSPPAIAVNPAVSPATCGSSNGSIDAVALGGTPNYTYNWLPPIPLGQQTNSVVTGIPAGVYTVIVTDAGTCSSTITIPLSNSNGPSGATITSTNVVCNGQCNGAAEVSNPVGGTPSYTLSWINPVSANALISGLCAGTYTAQIEDANNCLFFQSVSITQPQLIDDNEIISSAACFGNCNGAIALNPTGGNGGYTYSWAPSAGTGTVTGLCPGVYTATITDNQGCTLVANYTMPSITSITSSTFATNNRCFGDCNGSILATNVAGGLPPYSFAWNDPAGQSTPVASSLCNGSYSVTIKDANGCFNVIPASVTSPSQVTFTPTVTQPGCGQCDGAATISPVGGTPGYTLAWSNSQTGTSLTNLCAGVYMAHITDGNGCQSDTNIVINSSSTITGENIVKTDVSCSATIPCDGSVTITAIGGTAPITYHWVHNNSASQTQNNLCAGTYFCNMTDANGCIRTASVVIGATTNFTIIPQVTQSSCSSATGSVSVSVSGGTGTYSYAWTPNVSTTNTATGLAPGSYTLTVSDGNCSQTNVYSISSVNGPVITFTKKDISCSGVCDGNIGLTISGGTPAYTILWSNSASTPSISGLCAGAYSVEVTDAAGCKAVQNISLNTTSPIVFSTPDVNNPLCNNNCDGSITTIATGGTLPYTYSWTPTSPSAPTSNSLCAGNYDVLVTDVNGCSASESYTLTGPPAITLTAVVTDASCSTSPDGAVDITVGGGTPAYNYTWTPGNIGTQDLTNVLAGTYSVSIADQNGCRKDSSIVINAVLVINTIAGNDTVFCQNGTLVLDGSNSTGGTSYQWFELPSTTAFSSTLITTVSPVAGTTTYVLVGNNNGCIDQDTVVVTANALPVVDAGPFVSIPLLATAQIGGNPTCATGVTYTWSPGLTLNNPAGTNPVTSTTITTIFTVTVTDANGCFNSDTVTVFVYPEIKIPNGFSPNGDGKNDAWIIDNIQQFPDNEVEVYNRWGEQLFYSRGYAVPFDGRYKGKPLPVGTYYYVIKLNDTNNTPAYTGPLTIFR
jgi:gliding motility-associated-like protein